MINKVHNLDCLEGFSKLPDSYIDLTVTSPPYDDLRDYEGYNYNQKVFRQIAKELYRVTKPGGVVVWVIGDQTINGSETGTSFKNALYFKYIGFNLHDTMIYERFAANPSSNRYFQNFEYMFILNKGEIKTHNLIKDRLNKYRKPGGNKRRQKDGTFKSTGIKNNYDINGFRSNIWKYKTGGGLISEEKIVHEHPAAYPEKLAEDHIISWSNKNDIILDPMAGSGTTLKAAKKLNRKFIGFEISKKYCKIAEQRLKQEYLFNGL